MSSTQTYHAKSYTSAAFHTRASCSLPRRWEPAVWGNHLAVFTLSAPQDSHLRSPKRASGSARVIWDILNWLGSPTRHSAVTQDKSSPPLQKGCFGEDLSTRLDCAVPDAGSDNAALLLALRCSPARQPKRSAARTRPGCAARWSGKTRNNCDDIMG